MTLMLCRYGGDICILARRYEHQQFPSQSLVGHDERRTAFIIKQAKNAVSEAIGHFDCHAAPCQRNVPVDA